MSSKSAKSPSDHFVTAVRGVYASGSSLGAPGPDVTTPRPARDHKVTDASVPYDAQAGDPAASEPDSGQLIFTLVPASVSLIWTSSASPAITASEKPGGMMVPSAGLGTSPPFAPASRPPGLPALMTSISKRPASLDRATLTGSSGHWLACVSTAREQASPTARRTSSISDSATPLRRATAVATSLAVRTCAASGVKVTSTVAILCHPTRPAMAYFSDLRCAIASSTV